MTIEKNKVVIYFCSTTVPSIDKNPHVAIRLFRGTAEGDRRTISLKSTCGGLMRNNLSNTCDLSDIKLLNHGSNRIMWIKM
ncbi:CLUMA_CG015728, isoform A [Clunio marinus]|uniref:CLUMA_CG015728, isoform A n=1 Tax=Clunio marinus TaxID=568069 RepID=A0A1J1IQ30_9DIPT|nr:CLUMA_CG015728, isoform A [Clunio marinus]